MQTSSNECCCLVPRRRIPRCLLAQDMQQTSLGPSTCTFPTSKSSAPPPTLRTSNEHLRAIDTQATQDLDFSYHVFDLAR
jgi:hypothetical protein